MIQLIRPLTLGLVALLLAAAPAVSQQQTLPPGTVIGRLNIGPGPSQAIPFSVLSSNLFGSGSGIFGLKLSGDTNYAMVATDRTVLINAALTAPRTVTLPAAISITTGQQICIADAFGGVTSTNTLTIARSGSDTINGATSTVLGSAFGGVCLISDGVSKWAVSLPQFTPAGTGATTRTVESKLRDVVSVKDFGAKGDGTTDDTATINAAELALNAAGGGSLYFPKGTYIVTGVTKRTGTIWQGDGIGVTNIKLKASTTVNAVIAGLNAYTLFGSGTFPGIENWKIRDLTVDGNKAGGGSSDCIGVYGWAWKISGIESMNCTGWGVRSEYPIAVDGSLPDHSDNASSWMTRSWSTTTIRVAFSGKARRTRS